MECFCGCGRKVRLRMRPINKRGSTIGSDVANVRMMLRHGMQSPSAEAYVRDGELLCQALADAVHAGVDPGAELERETSGFMRFGNANFSDAAIGASIARSRMSVDDALAATRSGEWDPFADVEVPRG